MFSLTFLLKEIFAAPFYGWGLTVSRHYEALLSQPLRGDSLPFTT